MAKQHSQTIGITMGDPCGVGPEVVLKAVDLLTKASEPIEVILIGSRAVFEEAARAIGIPFQELKGKSANVRILDTGDFNVKKMRKRVPTAEAGRVSVECILKGIELALSGEIDALVTAPISKEAVRMAGYSYPGHTEMLKERTGAKRVVMMMIGKNLRVSFVTIHVPLKDAVRQISAENIFSTIMVTVDGLEKFFAVPKSEQRIGVCALNPHSGEGGLMGSEENEIILPAVGRAIREGVNCSGPIASDVIFHRAMEGEFDAVISLYHDQGTIPIKLLAFDSGVNLTLGLPIVRTSPTHGTAFDIAGTGAANPGSMLEAIRVANRLAMTRKASRPSRRGTTTLTALT